MSFEDLMNRVIGYSLLYVQSGDHRHYAKAKEAEATILLKLRTVSAPSEVHVLKERKGVPTVIEWNGERFTFDSQTTFRGGVSRSRKAKAK